MPKKYKYCPNCGTTNVKLDGKKGPHGEFYVAEDGCCDCYDLIVAYHCLDCSCVWYISTGEV